MRAVHLPSRRLRGRPGPADPRYEPITDSRDGRIKARRVPFADEWLLHTSDEMPADGQIKVPDAEQMAKLKTCLDVMLIRLAEPIGLHTRASGGGARRLWLHLRSP
jgi:hypothetical protein